MLSLEEAQSRAQDLVSAARKAGADAADAIYACNASTNVSVRLGALEDVERSEGEEIGLRVFIGQRSASISASDMNPATLATLVDRAIAMAREAPEDPYAGLAPEDRLLKKRPPALDLTDEEEPEPSALRERALMAEEGARGVPGITNSEGGGAANGRSQVALATSHGFVGAYAGTSHSTWASVLAGAGADMQRDHASHSVRHLEDLDDAEAVGIRAGQRAVARLHPVKVESGVMPVIFDPRIGSSLLGHLIGGMVGPAIARRSSFLLDSLGEALFDAGVTIIDDPLLPRGMRSRPFDGEGLPVARRALIDKGVLTGWLMDSASARQLGLEPTGHASRGGSGAPGASITNVHMEAGTISPGDLMADVKRGLYVTELIGMGVNGVTGDYSRGAAGFLIENGAVAHAVSEITIASNLKAMFRALTPASDLHFRYAMNVPTIRIDGMTVAGAEAHLRAVISAVADAADHALTLWADGETRVRQWEKVPGHPVCEADLAVNVMLRERLAAIDPDAGWLSEETADTVHRLGVRRVWVVDPIDGTRDYLRGRPGWSVSVALVEDGAVKIGLLAAPARNELWVAQLGQGATRNGQTLRAGSRTMLPGARVPADQLPRVDRDLVTVEKPNSIALRMAMVAADEADLVATVRWGNEWDVAAAALIVQEAGGAVTDALGDPLRFNRPQPTAFGLLCSAPGIHAAAVGRLAPRAREILGQPPG